MCMMYHPYVTVTDRLLMYDGQSVILNAALQNKGRLLFNLSAANACYFMYRALNDELPVNLQHVMFIPTLEVCMYIVNWSDNQTTTS